MVKKILTALLGAFITAFGLYEIHSFLDLTEGGVLGLTLLLDHHFDISPSVSSLILNIICYAIGWKILGRKFLIYSLLTTVLFSSMYKALEFTKPLFTNLYDHPLIASIMGGVFIGVGVGLCIRVGTAPTGDDALAMSLKKVLKVKIEWVYLFFDLAVLFFSLSYIPPKRIIFSLITVTLSSKIVGLVERAKFSKKYPN